MIKCANCQSSLAETAKFCPYCGTAVTQEAGQPRPTIYRRAPPQTSPIKAKSDNASGNTAILIVFNLIFAAIGGYLIMVVSPDLKGRYYNWLYGYIYFQTTESIAAMTTGAIFLLLSGIFLLQAIIKR